MSSDSPSPRLYDEREISSLLQRAVELQDTNGPPRTVGLSLEELQQIAAEAGIDPRSVALAAAEMERAAPGGEGPNFWGGPLSLGLTRVVEGEVDEAAWERMVAEIRQSFHDTGHVSAWGHALEWTHSGTSGGQSRVTATPRDGRTRIEVFWHEPVLAVPFFVPSLVLSVILPAILFEAIGLPLAQGIPLYILLVGMIFLLARTLLSRAAGKAKRQARALMTTLEQIAAEARPDRLTAEPSDREDTAPRIDLEGESAPETALLSEPALAQDWNREEEQKAWRRLERES